MSNLAGSAIAQNAGKLDKFNRWKPGHEANKWLLLAGASDPPENVQISNRRNRDGASDRSGSFLHGVKSDMLNMESVTCVGENLHNTVRDFYLKKDEAKSKIKKLFDICLAKKVRAVVYYTGHGEIGTGNWCFDDGTLSLKELAVLLPAGSFPPLLIADSCFSGCWANLCKRGWYGANFHCLSASPEFSVAWDGDDGGELTRWMLDKLDRPSTEPLYSIGDRYDYPVPAEFFKLTYTDLLSSEMQNTEKILISQSIFNGTISTIFGTHKQFTPRPATDWKKTDTHEAFMEYVEELKNDGKHIYSLACDDNEGFGVFAMEGFGTEQEVTWAEEGDIDVARTKTWLDAGYRITACGARQSRVYFVMTKGAKSFEERGYFSSSPMAQTYFSRGTWAEIETEIAKQRSEGKCITGVCYSTGRQQYLAVMTQSTAGQSHRWETDSWAEDTKWETDWSAKGHHPTIVFKDPTKLKNLMVVTEDADRTRATYRYNYPLEN